MKRIDMIKRGAIAFVTFWLLVFIVASFAYLRWIPLTEYAPWLRAYLMICSMLVALMGAVGAFGGSK